MSTLALPGLVLRLIAAATTPVHHLPPPAVQEPATRVLFVGNSFTFRNDVPALVAELGLCHDPPVRLVVAMVARDGMTLERHWEEGDVARRLNAEGWDIVILQEQSSRPLAEPERMETYVGRFAALAREAGTDVILFQTWPRVDQPETEEPLAPVYRRIAAAVGATVAPVGAAWSRARAKHPGLALYAGDGLHASPAGSRLAAAVILEAILRR
ncbi:MAG: SGNH/GDSL hydrolase family protein [Gemmatimonadales bacterium]